MARSKSIATFNSSYQEILTTLDKFSIDSNFDAVTRTEARAHASKLHKVSNLFLLKLFRIVFGYGDILTTYLQSHNIDPISISQKVSDYKRRLTVLRTDCGAMSRPMKQLKRQGKGEPM